MKNNADKLERIGNVTLNLNYYTGQDYYSEGPSEDTLLDIVTNNRESDFDRIIEDSRSWSVMYHLSRIRENVVAWIPFNENDSVLEIGAGCGAITGKLCEKAGKVTCIDLSKKRSTINATRHRDCDNLEIIVGNYNDIGPEIEEKYDYVTLIGVLEYAGSYIEGNDPYFGLLDKLKSHLKDDGKLIVAIENKYGLKYFAGCKEDHTGIYYDGIEGYVNYNGVKTFSINQLKAFADRLGMKYEFFYPYPDYKLPHTIYSDFHLPKTGELTTNLRNFDTDRIVTFDEAKVFDSMIEENLFSWFSNSYLMIMTKEDLFKSAGKFPIYAKYANERAEQFRTYTTLVRDENDNRNVYKVALEKKTNPHIKEIYENYETLSKLYEGTRLCPNKSTYIEGKDKGEEYIGKVSKACDMLELEYVEGVTLDKYIHKLEEAGDFEKLEATIREYCDIIMQVQGNGRYSMTADFNTVFGRREFSEDYAASPICNFDVIFSNIVLGDIGEDRYIWNVLDYEWVFRFPIPAKFLIYRALFYQFGNRQSSRYVKHLESSGAKLYSKYGFSDEECSIFAQMEQSFQLYIINGMASLEVMQAVMPSNAVRLDRVIETATYLRNLNLPMVFYCSDGMFTSDKHMNVLADVDADRNVSFDIKLSSEMRHIRIDPTEYPVFIHINALELTLHNGNKLNLERYLVNGCVFEKDTILFDTNDAQIVLNNLPEGGKTLHVSYGVSMIEGEFYKDIVKHMNGLKEKNRKEDTFKDKIMYKLRLKKKEVLPEGFIYNTEVKNDI